MPATIVELAVLGVDTQPDGRAALERLTAVGTVILLVGPAETARMSSLAAEFRDHPTIVLASWDGVDAARIESWQPRTGGSRPVDPQAVSRLSELRVEYGADWLIATDATLASARACAGLQIVCIGPAPDAVDPVRPDHQAHSLLDAVRHIEASSTFG